MRSLLLASVLLVACGSDGSSSSAGPGAAVGQNTVDDSCATKCAAQKKCSSTVDETTCINQCKNVAAPYVGKVRTDYVVSVTDCQKTASCDKIDGCDNTANASISPTGTAQAFCDDLVKKNTECKTGDTDKAKCLTTFKIWSDATLEQARGCFTKTCGEYPACALSTFGVGIK